MSVGVSLANAEVAPATNTYIGALTDHAGSITVETLQNEGYGRDTDHNVVTAMRRFAVNYGLGTGAQATARLLLPCC